jgi:hypothetical protein
MVKSHEIWDKFISFIKKSNYTLDNLIGYEIIEKIEQFVEVECPEIKIIPCDDGLYCSSILLLIPHPQHGITVLFVPQHNMITNHFFLYNSHYKELLKNLKKMSNVYKYE